MGNWQRDHLSQTKKIVSSHRLSFLCKHSFRDLTLNFSHFRATLIEEKESVPRHLILAGTDSKIPSPQNFFFIPIRYTSSNKLYFFLSKGTTSSNSFISSLNPSLFISAGLSVSDSGSVSIGGNARTIWWP